MINRCKCKTKNFSLMICNRSHIRTCNGCDVNLSIEWDTLLCINNLWLSIKWIIVIESEWVLVVHTRKESLINPLHYIFIIIGKYCYYWIVLFYITFYLFFIFCICISLINVHYYYVDNKILVKCMCVQKSETWALRSKNFLPVNTKHKSFYFRFLSYKYNEYNTNMLKFIWRVRLDMPFNEIWVIVNHRSKSTSMHSSFYFVCVLSLCV